MPKKTPPSKTLSAVLAETAETVLPQEERIRRAEQRYKRLERLCDALVAKVSDDIVLHRYVVKHTNALRLEMVEKVGAAHEEQTARDVRRRRHRMRMDSIDGGKPKA